MRYYAHFGHEDFILCLGYRGDLIREYFLNYKECLSNDFTLSEGGRRIELHSTDLHDRTITFVDTGLHASIAQRRVPIACTATAVSDLSTTSRRKRILRLTTASACAAVDARAGSMLLGDS